MLDSDAHTHTHILNLLAFQLNVLLRLNDLENGIKEGNAMMRTILSGLHMSVEQNEDLVTDPMETEEELGKMEEELKNQMFRKKMVSAYNQVFAKSVELHLEYLIAYSM